MTTVGGLGAALLLKPTVIIAGAWLLGCLLKRRGAAARHASWTGAVVALVALPLLTFVLPPLRLEVGTALAPLFATSAPTATGARPIELPAANTSLAPGSSREPNRDTLFANLAEHLGGTLLSLWAIVALVLACRRIAAEVAVGRLVERGRQPRVELAARCHAAASARGLHSVRFVLSDETASPGVAGLRRPVVLLPHTADEWTDAQIDAVLTHELSHVGRRDCLINLLSDLAASFYWCNPLVYFASRRVRAEGELACDENVVRAGSDPDAYALMLLDFARATLATRTLPRVMTAAARPSELESRVIALLDVRQSSAPLRSWMAVALSAMVPAVAFPIASATVHATAPAFDQPAMIGRAQVGEDSLAAGTSERLSLTVDPASLAAAARRALSGPDSALAAVLVGALDHTPQHENDLIRERAAWALSMTRDDQLLEPVVEALSSSDWRTQAYAAWTVTVAGDRKSVPRLIVLLEHPVWRVRAMAAAALRSMGPLEAAEPMIPLLGDSAWQVRLEIVEYLGALDAAKYSAHLRARLDDEHLAVRRAALRLLNGDR